jgi:RNA polymerase sigma-70 factor (ECF subfamily)
MTSQKLPTAELALVDAARGGDEAAFGRLVETHRDAVHALCYRMLGSPHDADDALQETLVRAWRALARFDGRSALRTWMHRIAINVCLDEIARRPRRVLPTDCGPPLPAGSDDPVETLDGARCLQPYPDELVELGEGLAGPDARYEQREALELAFVAALQYLPPKQRAVFVLRDVLSFSAREVAEMLSVSPVSVNSALQRARGAIERRLPEQSQQESLRQLGDSRLRTFVRHLIDAFERGEVAAILALLAEDAVFSMPPYRGWYQGRDHIADSWWMPTDRPTGLRFLSTRANGQLALGVYKLDAETNRYLPNCLEVFGLRGELVAEVASFREPGLVRAFGLPGELSP